MDGGDADRGALKEQKEKEKAAKKERAAANKAEKKRRSHLWKKGLALDSEVSIVRQSMSNQWYNLNDASSFISSHPHYPSRNRLFHLYLF